MDIMNVYIARNNMQVQFVRFRQKISPLFRFSFSNQVIQCNIAQCCLTVFTFTLGVIQVLRSAVGVGGCQLSREKALRRCTVQR